ncbi:hypothetical protein TRFO_29186 [Tritrichomonas foetus]|uniref:CCDC93 coiled-coil domain-containing protein n=1 Tax=Tritrichomonas foetus TaxID=1144522 RepID=A0A1J4JXJ0_9EUKA|nr:hypothetical protein TRFO_29186 [Tritrichomonas foetus]|eukprot:OHT03386.1 hypothetical protein TRFO_29186 [Tritrichomonas foetus]
MRQVKPVAAAQQAPHQANAKFAAAAAAVGGKLAPGNAASKSGEPTEEELQKINEERQKEMKDTIKKMVKTDADISIDGATFAALINNEEDIVAQKAKRELEHLNAVPESKITESQLRGPHEQKMQALREELENFKTEGRKIKLQYDESHAKLEEVTELYNAAADQNMKLKRQIAKCNKIIEESQHTDDLLRAISVRDDTQRNYEIFKNQCLSEMKEWQEKIEKLKEIQNSGDEENSLMIKNTLEQLERNWEQKQAVLADKERDLLKLRTDYDQVPTNAELTQYDKRLNELAMLGEQKVNEQKKCKQLLDALVSSQEVLTDENELFNSILKQFNKAINDSKLQTKLLDHMDSISRKTGERKKTVTEELKKKHDILSQKDDTHRKLQENQRKYFQTIKEFQQACDELASLRGEEE